jgi:hypothetical protein
MASDKTTRQPCAVIDAVMDDLLERQAVGIKTYGVTLSEAPIDFRGWLQHQYEELLDAACYTKAALNILDRDRAIRPVLPEDTST